MRCRSLPLPTAYWPLAAVLLLAGCQPTVEPEHAVSGPLAGRVEATADEERTVTLDGRTLVLDGFAGNVQVETDARAAWVRVRFVRRARGATEASAQARLEAISIEEGQDHELVQYVWRASGNEDGLSVDVVATVPPQARVVVRTGSGGVAADGPLAEFDAETRAGSVVVGRASGARVRLASGEGDVSLAAARIPPGARWTAETAAGSLDLSLPPSASVQIDAETAAGRIDVRGVEAAVERSRRAAGEKAVVRLGGAEARIALATRAGSITVGRATDVDGTETGRTDE